MIYLVLAILSSSSIALLFKYTEGYNLNRYLVTSANYAVALLISLYTFIEMDTMPKVRLLMPFASGASNDRYFSIAVYLGFIVGIFYLSSFILYQVSVRDSGASVSGMAMKLGILVPVVLSIILWHEYPSAVNSIGILLALIAIVIINYSNEESVDLSSSLFLLFFIGGLAEFSSKLFQMYSAMVFQPVFLSVLFSTALILSLILYIKNGRGFDWKALGMGALVGIPNMFSAYFMILALQTVRATIAFPIFSAGTIVVITLGSRIIYNEVMLKKDHYAVGLTIMGLVLLNI